MWVRKKEHIDPITGDVLTRQERLSIMAQAAVRQWKFVLAYSALTFVWWAEPHWFGDDSSYVHWQLQASFLAIVLEAVIGIGMFGWARRDSIVLRKIMRLEAEADRARDRNEPVMRAVAQTLGIPYPDDDHPA
jgi:hypothetical protein